MPKSFVVAHCSLPVADNVCFNLGAYIITAQPIYDAAKKINPYVDIAKAGVHSVLCVRDPAEVNTHPNPFDVTEASQLILNHVDYANVPLPHIPMTQGEFNRQAAYANGVITTWRQPILIHCSTGDRASAAFAVHLIVRYKWPNADAVKFATTELALQNQQFIQYVLNFSAP